MSPKNSTVQTMPQDSAEGGSELPEKVISIKIMQG